VRIDLLTGRVRGRLNLRCDDALLAPDGRHVAAHRWRGELHLYRVDTGAAKRLALGADEGCLYGLAFRADG
jgi:hypothetical protein